MPSVFKVIHEDEEENIYLYGSSAEIVGFDSTQTRNLDASNVQEAIKLVNDKTEEKAKLLSFDTIIVARDFVGTTAPYTERIEVAGILGTDRPDVGVRLSSEVALALEQREAFGCITQIETGSGFIVVKCYEDKPRVDIPIQIRVLR